MATTKVKARAHVEVKGVAAGSTVRGIFTADIEPGASKGKKPMEYKAEAEIKKNGTATLEAELPVESSFWFKVTDVRQGSSSYPLRGDLGPVQKKVPVATVKSIDLRYGV